MARDTDFEQRSKNWPPPPDARYTSSWGYKLKTGKPGDVGHDLHVHVIPRFQSIIDMIVSLVLRKPVYVIWPFATKLLHSGIAMSVPENIWYMIRSRSSASQKRLMVLGGTIDSGYRGELRTLLYNFGLKPRLIKDGERYAQVVFVEAVRPHMWQVKKFDHLDATVRGSTGFGSTGR